MLSNRLPQCLMKGARGLSGMRLKGLFKLKLSSETPVLSIFRFDTVALLQSPKTLELQHKVEVSM